MSITRQRMNRIIKEEMNRAFDERGMSEMMDPNYNDDLQSRLGRFTTPENVKGTPQHRAAHGPYVSDRRGAPSTPMGPASAEELERINARLADRPPQPFNTYYGPNSPDSSYYDLREADDDMDMDTGIDVVPDDEMGGEEDMGMPMSGEEMEPVATEIDWSQFEDEDTDVVGVAFFDALKQLREESPDEEPTAEAVVALMQELLAGDTEEDMGGEEMEDEAAPEEEESMGGDEESALNEWVRRTNLLAGTSKRR